MRCFRRQLQNGRWAQNPASDCLIWRSSCKDGARQAPRALPTVRPPAQAANQATAAPSIVAAPAMGPLDEASAQRVPHVSGHGAVLFDHAFHFGHGLGCISDKPDDQRHGGHVKLAIGKWQRLRIAGLKGRAARRRSIAGVGNLTLNRIDGANVQRSAAVDNELSECASAATDIEPVSHLTGQLENSGWRDINALGLDASCEVP
jgi:hypothetical protein